MTNETIASQLAHRTIRAYKDQPLTEAEVTTLHTSTCIDFNNRGSNLFLWNLSGHI